MNSGVKFHIYIYIYSDIFVKTCNFKIFLSFHCSSISSLLISTLLEFAILHVMLWSIMCRDCYFNYCFKPPKAIFSQSPSSSFSLKRHGSEPVIWVYVDFFLQVSLYSHNSFIWCYITKQPIEVCCYSSSLLYKGLIKILLKVGVKHISNNGILTVNVVHVFDG